MVGYMSDVLIRTEGCAGHITLNRPSALNALTHRMCLAIDAALRAWEDDPDVALILIDGAGERAFCAGGDVVELHRQGARGEYGFGRGFWRDEYAMNDRIGCYPKPVVALIHGFCMGGGVGLACHASHRIVGETAQLAMPECQIGLVPDVGGTALLARAPGQVGTWLALTGQRMSAGDAIFAGFADAHVPQSHWPDLIRRLIAGDIGAIARFAIDADSGIPEIAALVDRCFAQDDVAMIRDCLGRDGSSAALAAAKCMDRASPLSLAATLAILRSLGPDATLQQALEMEFRFTFRVQEHGDFQEGVRASLIDKDHSPRWRHIGAVPQIDVAELLAPLGPDALNLERTARRSWR